MFKSLIIVSMLTLIGLPAQASTLEEFNTELAKSNKVIQAEMDKLGKVLSGLPKSDIDKLNTSFVGDESMSESDILIMSSDMVLGGISGFNFYLEHH